MNAYTSQAERETECRRSKETIFETGSVSKSIKANYLNGQAGLFKLVSFHAAYTAERETWRLNKPQTTDTRIRKGLKKPHISKTV
jgi:hypothetical protein